MADLIQLLKNHSEVLAKSSVPHWMLGAFKRRNITFYDGMTDVSTNVFWLQTQTLTIDLRLPISEEQARQNTIEKLSNEAWYGYACWKDNQLSWSGGASYEFYNKWPEPAELRRIGDCMIEFAPSGAYVEDWRLLSSGNGPLIGLELFQEEDIPTGKISPRKGALIICGDSAGLVIDRQQNINKNYKSLNDAYEHGEKVDNLLGFEASIGQKISNNEYKVIYSLSTNRIGENLLSMNNFEINDATGVLVQTLEKQKRYFKIETYFDHFYFSKITPTTDQALHWYKQESKTLGRYANRIHL